MLVVNAFTVLAYIGKRKTAAPPFSVLRQKGVFTKTVFREKRFALILLDDEAEPFSDSVSRAWLSVSEGVEALTHQ